MAVSDDTVKVEELGNPLKIKEKPFAKAGIRMATFATKKY